MKMVTPTSWTPGARQKSPKENSNPNFSSPVSIAKSAGVKNPNLTPKVKIRERRFVVAKKKNRDSNLSCKCKDKIGGKYLCVDYESLRPSQEVFFERTNGGVVVDGDVERGKENKPLSQNIENSIGCEKIEFLGSDGIPQLVVSPNVVGNVKREKDNKPVTGLGGSMIKPRRDSLMEEARKSVPEPGSGRVKHLVKAFERLLTIPNGSEKKYEDETKKGIKWPLPGLQQHSRASETQQSSSAFCPGELFFNAESLGLDSRVSSSFGSRRGSVSSRSSHGSRRSGSFSSGTASARNMKKKQQQDRQTSMRPFKLRTEERGKAKEEEFLKKLQEMMIEEEKQRIPIAQGLPWTTDIPKCLIKPPVKECTHPIDLKLHSDERAVERAEFDHQVNEKMMLIEQYRLEREMQMKVEEEEEIRRLRKELVPKAQPMPYFIRPFVPKRSVKQPKIPKEPKFCKAENKKTTNCGLYTCNMNVKTKREDNIKNEAINCCLNYNIA